MFYRKLVVSLFAAAVCTVCYTQTSLPDEGITLRDAIMQTLESNPRLDSFPLREESLSGQRDMAALNPALSFNTELENVLGTGDMSGIESAELTLALSRVVEMGDKREARIATVNRRIDILDAEQRVLELDLIAETTFRFIEVAAAQERLQLQMQARTLAQQTRTLLQPLVDAGQSPQLELTRADAALRRAQLAEDNAQAMLESTKVRLASMWGSQAPSFSSVMSSFYDPGESGSLTGLLAQLQSNPNIAIYASESRLLEARMREAQAQQRTDIQWSAGIKHSFELEDTGFVVGFSAPLNTAERASGLQRSVRADLQEVNVRRESSLNQMRGQLFSLHRRLSQALEESTVLQEEVLPLLTQLLEQTQEAYQNGLYSYVELISAQQEYLDAELALINSLTNAHTLRAEIERLSGSTLSEQ